MLITKFIFKKTLQFGCFMPNVVLVLEVSAPAEKEVYFHGKIYALFH